MANEDPDSIPDQFRHNRPFFLVFALAFVIAAGTFMYILFRDTEAHDIERNLPVAAAPATS